MRTSATGSTHERSTRAAFSLLELAVVVGILALLLAALMPALTQARARAKALQCLSNLRQNYTFLMMYSHENRGQLFPYNWGEAVPKEMRWPVYVFRPRVWNPPTMTCSADEDGAQHHSYVLNAHLVLRGIRFGRTSSTPLSTSEIVLMGEKRSTEGDYYVQAGDIERVLERYRHGASLGAGYLFLDGHVEMSSQTRGWEIWDAGGSSDEADTAAR